ncbi:MAG TPA: hypothetical protein PLW02_03280 [Verrucomicrobiota bacterium]|nr:hypothetical protein [Verrucomicrobiota bacterium]
MINRYIVKVGERVFICAVCVIALSITQGQTNAKVADSPSSLKDVSVLELPAAASQIVAQAPQEKRAEVASDTVRMAARFANPGVLPYVASSICKTSPDVAPVVLSEAIDAKPDEILPLTKASLAAAPSKIEELVKVAVKARPEYFSAIARLADKEVPNKTQEILNGVKAGLPQLNIYIDKAVSTVTSNSVPVVMEYVEKSVIAEAKTQAIENRRIQILNALENQNTVSTVEPTITKTATAYQKAKNAIAAAEKSISSGYTSSPDGVKNSLGGPRIIPISPIQPLTTIKPADTDFVTPGSARNYSSP